MLQKNYTIKSDEPENDSHYMSHKQLEYFRDKLIKWHEALQKESQEQTIEVLQPQADTDLTDMAIKEYNTELILKTRQRNEILTIEINKALQRIENGSYGYCEETGEEIGIARLKANPITLYCIEEQERREKQQQLYNDTELEDNHNFLNDN
ncbi:DNAK suppressor protein [Ehrlichia ruminantium]|uniref:DNAK suppressor protein homolog n=1 Tax=Ehrlichia ruminantium (strain Welgevonden) TaxID=254945 RepID=A0A0H3M078_EHRRW|nr:TraR/DksA family transcriptional regulator [Ehrlichia ruminantium]KYW93682.1 molecular chaperone DnaK [Ehrlichia ruminantium]QLK50120.1 TraR/DksA family transcriptional regulator [Ehrlichia ruminantium]QLK51045.1 TraR/DksA family transcriptional regulator [Ehrlichia ruminantium]QLK51969.1 TraR/DksA family transcriptional regulator [Ehrlichia ruminantium]QLK52879.1 TraR/DksA family transcriptional regulator [Ehrlichia ruminantium]